MKYRNEIKYVIKDTDAEQLKAQLRCLLTPDTHAKNKDGNYCITSLYFDTLDSSAYYEKMNGVLNRRKFRIRYYDGSDSFIRLEKKMKHNNMTAKQQARLTREQYDQLIHGRAREVVSDHPLIQEFVSLIEAEHLMPSVVVEYHRLAFTYPISEIRITFDSKIRSGVYSQDPLVDPGMMVEVLDPGTQVLEVKFNEVLPVSIAGILATIPTCREAVSKFARCAGWK